MDSTLRLADTRDLQGLVDLCRTCFPESAMWHCPAFVGKGWWRTVLRFEPGEVWVAQDGSGEGLLGCCAISFDERAWERQRWARLGRVRYPLGLLLRPRVMVPFVRRRCARLRKAKRLASRAAAPAPSGSKGRSEPPPVGTRGWLDLLATHPDTWGSGLAQRLMSRAEERLRESGCDGVALVVETGNVRGQRFYARLGYALVGQKSGRLLMATELAPE
jgi:ribosomal protein S18 acetylase RimI-like enzyme